MDLASKQRERSAVRGGLIGVNPKQIEASDDSNLFADMERPVGGFLEWTPNADTKFAQSSGVKGFSDVSVSRVIFPQQDIDGKYDDPCTFTAFGIMLRSQYPNRFDLLRDSTIAELRSLSTGAGRGWIRFRDKNQTGMDVPFEVREISTRYLGDTLDGEAYIEIIMKCETEYSVAETPNFEDEKLSRYVQAFTNGSQFDDLWSEADAETSVRHCAKPNVLVGEPMKPREEKEE